MMPDDDDVNDDPGNCILRDALAGVTILSFRPPPVPADAPETDLGNEIEGQLEP